MRIRELTEKDQKDLLNILEATGVFKKYEIDLTDEVIRQALNPASDHSFYFVNKQDRSVDVVRERRNACSSGQVVLYSVAMKSQTVEKELLGVAEADPTFAIVRDFKAEEITK